jgi:hypothetical protein
MRKGCWNGFQRVELFENDALAAMVRGVHRLLHPQVGQVIASRVFWFGVSGEAVEYMALQGRACAATKTQLGATVIGVLGLWPVVWLPPQASLTVQAQHAMQTPSSHISPIVRRGLVGHMVVQAVAIE